MTSCGFFSWHFFRFFWKFKPYHYLGIFPQRKATPVHTVKLRDVDRSTIQFCTLLAKDFTVSVCPWPNGLKIRLIIKISTHPCYPRNFDCFSWGWSRKKNEKKNPKWPTQKSMFYKTVNSQYFFAKILQIGPWSSKINWCEGHYIM